MSIMGTALAEVAAAVRISDFSARSLRIPPREYAVTIVPLRAQPLYAILHAHPREEPVQ